MALAIVVIGGCDATTGAPEIPTVWQADDASSVILINWSATAEGALVGELQLVQDEGSDVEVTRTPFVGQLGEDGRVSLTIERALQADTTIVGQVSSRNLTLGFPTDSGLIEEVSFAPSTIAAFNDVVANLQKQAAARLAEAEERQRIAEDAADFDRQLRVLQDEAASAASDVELHIAWAADGASGAADALDSIEQDVATLRTEVERAKQDELGYTGDVDYRLNSSIVYYLNEIAYYAEQVRSAAEQTRERSVEGLAYIDDWMATSGASRLPSGLAAHQRALEEATETVSSLVGEVEARIADGEVLWRQAVTIAAEVGVEPTR